MRVLFLLIACTTFFFGAQAYAAPLSFQQSAALKAELVKRAPTAPVGVRQPFTAAAGLAGAMTFDAQVGQCRHVVIDISSPAPDKFETRVCLTQGGGKEDNGHPGPPTWTANAPITPMPTAAPTKPSPPPPSPTPVVEKAVPGPPRASPGAPGDAPSADDAKATPGGQTGGGVERVISPVLVELGPSEARFPRNGGSGVVLLSENPADGQLNLLLCRALFNSFDTARPDEVVNGERTKDDKLELLRPLYWPLKDVTRPALGADKCAHRIAHYDFARAWKIRSKLGLNGRGPYLLVIRADESRAGLVDFAGVQLKDAANLVRYFREGFSQDADIWSPARHGEAAERAALTKYLGASFPLAALPRLVIVSVVRAGCPLANTLDVCTNPMPR